MTMDTPKNLTNGATQVAPVGSIEASEDLTGIPGTHWLIVSVRALAPDGEGRLDLVNTSTHAIRALYPSPEAQVRFDAHTFHGQPDRPPERFNPHGLTIRRGANGVHQLLVVHHGVRESVEIFTFDTRDVLPRIHWRGCVLTPGSVTGNGVAPMPDGFVMTQTTLPIPKKGGRALNFEEIEGGRSIGEVLAWSSRSGWSKVDTGGDLMPNGIETSADGEWLYYADSVRQTFNRFSFRAGAAKKHVIQTGFHSDNVHWAPDGSLLLAGQQGTLREIVEYFSGKEGAACGNARVLRIDPQTMSVQPLVDCADFPLASGAVEIQGTLWLGRIRGTIGRVDLRQVHTALPD